MNIEPLSSSDVIDRLYKRLNQESKNSGYHLNPNIEHTKALIKSLIINEQRYGYWACPCRLASGKKQEDLDIICPCDYRDSDLNEYDICYCGLYVSTSFLDNKKELESIPERRPEKEKRLQFQVQISEIEEEARLKGKYTVWRCRVCGYLCARNEPPETCPICKEKKDRFEPFIY